MQLEKMKANYDVDNHNEEPIPVPEMPVDGLVLVVGSSGSGKSTILRQWFGDYENVRFDSRMVIENFSTLERGEELLKAVGLRSIPTWFRPYCTLSNGEQHRAFCALSIDRGVMVVDEFTSVVDRDTAKSLAATIRKWHKSGRLVIATCHRDVEEWLCPDIVYDTDARKFLDRRYLQRPSVQLTIKSSTVEDWVYFKRHHYLTSEISRSCHFYTGFIGAKRVAFYAIMHSCNRDIHTYWRGSRLVILPEFQGLGIGMAFAEAVAQEYLDRGLRFFEKTAHPLIGEYRNRSDRWRGTSTNGVRRSSYLKDGKVREQKGFGKTAATVIRDEKRICYSHEFIGRQAISTMNL